MTDQTSPPAKPRRWVRYVLFVSLALNLLVIGAVAGTLIRFQGPGGPAGGSAMLGVSIYRALPDENRRALRASLRRAVSREDTPRQRSGLAGLDAALRAEPFDLSAVEAVVVAQGQRRATELAALQAEWLSQVAAMSRADRVAYADRLREIGKRHGPKPPREP